MFEELNPRGPVSISGMLHFRGTNDPADPVTAAWDLKTVFAGNSLKLGVELKNVHGRVFSRGTWDGKTVAMTGKQNRFDLDSIHVQGYQFTKVQGPFWMYDKDLIVGSAPDLQAAQTRREEAADPLEGPRLRDGRRRRLHTRLVRSVRQGADL